MHFPPDWTGCTPPPRDPLTQETQTLQLGAPSPSPVPSQPTEQRSPPQPPTQTLYGRPQGELLPHTGDHPTKHREPCSSQRICLVITHGADPLLHARPFPHPPLRVPQGS
ncbi:interferon-related developmental regulator 1 [Platysternon megacephalum]|uniref:Interferon-related developmental regulator 1 n=1 Tax=Platysternon megacephalum TaxID=55544 RepID=A0A4D9ETA8_9SAUR|nr:interferon-related developmental regulator 1 [Platysternon megacephalum]